MKNKALARRLVWTIYLTFGIIIPFSFWLVLQFNEPGRVRSGIEFVYLFSLAWGGIVGGQLIAWARTAKTAKTCPECSHTDNAVMADGHIQCRYCGYDF